MIVATDLDGTFGPGLDPPPTICITGRTWAEYDDTARLVAQLMPLYLRGVGAYGDRQHAGMFKLRMITMLGVTRFYENDPVQVDIIRNGNPSVDVVLVERSDGKAAVPLPPLRRRRLPPTHQPPKPQRSVW